MYKGREQKCAICGNLFITKSPNSKYCSKECSKKGSLPKKRASVARKKERTTTKSNSSLSEIERQARQAGMHYGLYVGLNNL